jgi:hypothetical protein
MVSNPFRSLGRKRQTGFIYIADERRDLRFAGAAPGDVIRNETREAPWLVVNHTLDGVLVTDWPGSLWEAEVVDAINPQNHKGDYTRAVAVRILRQVPPHELFGPNGEAVVWILDRTARLTREEAETLSRARAPEAGALYSRAWLNWPEMPDDKRVFEDWEGVIGAGGTIPPSPVGRGLSAVFNSVCANALRAFGDNAWYTTDGPEVEDPDMHLAEPWYTAALCLLEAAMALGAPHLLSEADRKTLTAPWHALTRSSLS